METISLTSVSPLGFEALPIEVQREVLLKYFEDPCTVTFYRKNTLPFTHNVHHRLGKAARFGLSSKHLFNETVLALKTSPHTILEFQESITFFKITHIDTDSTVREFARHTRTIHTQHFFYDIGFESYQRLAPNLREIIIPFDGRSAFGAPRLEALMRGRELHSIVQGQHDEDITSTIRKEFSATMKYWLPNWRFGGVALNFFFCFRIETYWMTDAPLGTELREYQFVVEFEISEDETALVRKVFWKHGSGGDAHVVNATEGSMDRLTALNPQDMEKAATAMWYLRYLPQC